MKVFAVGLVVSTLLLGACQPNQAPEEEVQVPNPTLSPAEKLMTHVSLTVPGTDVIVSISSETGPTVEYEDGPVRGTVTLMEAFVQPINQTDYVAPIAVNSGGSGTFLYLSAFQPGEASFQMTDAQPLGDRVDIKEVGVRDDMVNVVYMEHGADQAMAEAPSVEVIKTYQYDNGRLTEKVE